MEEWLRDAASHIQPRLAAYKAFQEAAGATADLAAMAVVDAGRAAKDDYRNLELAAEAGAVTAGLVPALQEATGLRNRLVHEYNGLDDARALESMEELLPALRSGLEGVEAWIASRK